MLLLLVGIAIGFIVVERLWPASQLPHVDGWWGRVTVCNLLQIGIIILAGKTWDVWLKQVSIVRLQDHLGDVSSALVAYVISTFIYYWWHRVRHDSAFFWRICHQLHHSPARIEILTSFYKHPVEITINSLISSSLVYLILGCSVTAGAYYTIFTAVAEYFYHWNVRTPRWLGTIIQRPESHRVHHQYRRHTNNFADLPLWDMMFGTYENPHVSPARCGFDEWREDRFEDMLGFRDLHAKGADKREPLRFLPTCFGCRKRWACADSKQRAADEETRTANDGRP